MTAEELIERLKTYPSNFEVRIDTRRGPESLPLVFHGTGSGYESERILLLPGELD